MSGRLLLSVFVAAIGASSASAQVVVRVPFVRVETGGGYTYVRAPFVNLFVPSAPPVYYGPPPGAYFPGPQVIAPQVITPSNPSISALPPPRSVPQPFPSVPAPPKPNQPTDGEPPINPDLAPPAPAQPAKAPTVDEFVKSFKPKAGNYEVTLINPVNRQAEIVRFSLPRTPQRVQANRNGFEFIFGPRQFVRIEFDQDGPTVISR